VFEERRDRDAQCACNPSQDHERRVYAAALNFSQHGGVDAGGTGQRFNRDFGLTVGERLSVPLNAEASDTLPELDNDAPLVFRQVSEPLLSGKGRHSTLTRLLLRHNPPHHAWEIGAGVEQYLMKY
jgi:hypothetical protein